jgi:broad specificity phosphatase PhoE
LPKLKTGIYFKKIRKINSDNCCIYSSLSIRATETAAIIANQLKFDKPIITDMRLNEVDHGDLSGSVDGDPIYNKAIKLHNEFIKSTKNDPIDTELKYPEYNKKMNKMFHEETNETIHRRILSIIKTISAKKQSI